MVNITVFDLRCFSLSYVDFLGDQKLSICNSFPIIVGLLVEPNEVVLANACITIQEYSRQINTSK